MAKASGSQRKTAGRVMHEFKHGELKSGRAGKAGKVKSRKQAIAIALHESGASKYETKSKNKASLARSKRKEAKGETYQQEREGKSHVGAKGKRESSPPMRRQKPSRSPKAASRSRGTASTKSNTTTRRTATHKRKAATASRKRKAS